MKVKVFAIWDAKAKLFGFPFCLINEGVAVRMFTEIVNDKKSQESKYPTDYALYVIGEYDQATGEVLSDKPVSLGLGSAFVFTPQAPE